MFNSPTGCPGSKINGSLIIASSIFIGRRAIRTLAECAGSDGSTLGVRYDITNYAAFKGEYRNSRQGVNEPRVNGAFFQTAFTF